MQNDKQKPTFAVIGLGFIADRHIASIAQVGGELVMACDIDADKEHKANGAAFFTNWEDMYKTPFFQEGVDYVVICTPNYLHSAMATVAAGLGKTVLVEKPLALELKDVFAMRRHFPENIFNVVQLRDHPDIKKLHRKRKHLTEAEFIVDIHRGDWYFDTWKGNDAESGGLLFNIGVHYFDLLIHFFGKPTGHKLFYSMPKKAEGEVHFKNANAKWKLSIDASQDNQRRSFMVNGQTINLTNHIETLHVEVYKKLLAGKGVPISEVVPVIKLISSLTNERRH